jgi:hypothetical protein
MKLPVSHARFALLLHNYDEAKKLYAAGLAREQESSATWKALFDAERLRNDGLVQELLDLKQQGFTSATQRVSVPAAMPSKIEDAINEKAGTNGALRRHLSRWAAQQQATNKSEDAIVEALTEWRDPDGDEAET